MSHLTPREAERITHCEAIVLSYLTGLAPAGEEIRLRGDQLQWLHADLSMTPPCVVQFLKKLTRKGFLERSERGMYRVVRRLEGSGVYIVPEVIRKPPRPKKSRPIKIKPFQPVRYAGWDRLEQHI